METIISTDNWLVDVLPALFMRKLAPDPAQGFPGYAQVGSDHV